MSDSLHDPSLSALYLFHSLTTGEPHPTITELGLAAALGMEKKTSENGEMHLSGPLPGGILCELDGGLAHDTHILRLTLRLPGAQPAGCWGRLKAAQEDMIGRTWQSSAGPLPWAASLLYHAALSEDFSQSDLVPALTDPKGLALSEDRLEQFETLSYGWFLCIGDYAATLGAASRCWQRDLVLLTPYDRVERVQTYFLVPLVQGLARIELYLHKSLHHARQQVLVRDELGRARVSLQNSMRAALQTTDFSQLHHEQLELEAISSRLMHFQTQKAYAEVLLNTLRVNTKSFEEHMKRVKLRSKIYNHELEKLHRHIEQLKSDLENAQIVADSTYAFQDIQRGIEASRFERASYLMGSTAALLAGIAIFNSFLDIWVLAVDGSGLSLPPTGLRIALGVIAGISWPLAAYGIVQRRRAYALIWTGIGVLMLLAAALSTLLVSR